MGGIGDQPAALGIGALQGGGHVVEAPGQLAEFILPDFRHPDGQVAGLNPGGRPVEDFHRPDDMRGQQQSQAHGQQEDSGRDGPGDASGFPQVVAFPGQRLAGNHRGDVEDSDVPPLVLHHGAFGLPGPEKIAVVSGGVQQHPAVHIGNHQRFPAGMLRPLPSPAGPHPVHHPPDDAVVPPGLEEIRRHLHEQRVFGGDFIAGFPALDPVRRP